MLCSNPHAVSLLENNLNNLNDEAWERLSQNPNAIEILKNNYNKIDWKSFCQNTSIFEEWNGMK